MAPATATRPNERTRAAKAFFETLYPEPAEHSVYLWPDGVFPTVTDAHNKQPTTDRS